MPRNPLTDPLLEPTLIRIAGLLVLAVLIILIVERGRIKKWRESVLIQRVGSWAMMAPVFSISVFTGGFVALALVTYLSVQGIAEYSKLIRLERPYRFTLMAYGIFALLVTGYWGHRFFLFLPLGFFAVVTLIPLIRLSSQTDREPKAELLQLAGSSMGYLWIPFFLSFFALIGRTESKAVAILLLLGFGVALSDVLAFTIGKIIGGPKLSRVSPNKTWSGVAGNVAGAYLAFWVMAFAIPSEWSTTTTVVLPAIVALGALWGDLVESMVKRGFAVKDTGDLLPGFGGILDRIDSLLLAMPLSFYAMKILQYYTASGP